MNIVKEQVYNDLYFFFRRFNSGYIFPFHNCERKYFLEDFHVGIASSTIFVKSNPVRK